MKRFLLLFAFVSILTNAQNQRFIYEYHFAVDSTNRDHPEKELMVLEVNPKESKFYSYEKFKLDSINAIELEKQMNSNSEVINFSNFYKGKLSYTVLKTHPNFDTFFKIFMGEDEYKVKDDRKMVWKILPEKEKIGEFNAQRADTQMYGRKWTAWFTTEIPIQDGPYKFHGLPGLIVKIQDKTNSHSFELKAANQYLGSAKLATDPRILTPKEIEISDKQYKKIYLEIRNDPTKILKQMMSKGGEIKLFDGQGKELNAADVIRQREQNAKEDRRKNNNLLELDLLK